MKERPIIFSAPMVRALLDGRKTQTRRVVKPQPTHLNPAGVPRIAQSVGNSKVIACPYGRPGDRLWVRETWCGEVDCHTSQLIYNEDGNTYKCLYRADGHHVVLDDGDGFTKTNKDGSEASPWKPSIHMPRWASRITLEIVSVRVDRLQDISEADAQAEGVYTDPACPAYDAYAALWDQINGAGSWDLNPLVWVIEFKKVEAA